MKINRLNFIKLVIILNPFIDMLFKIMGENDQSIISINQLIRIVLFVISLFFIRNKKSFLNIICLSVFLVFIILMQSYLGLTLSLFTDLAFIIKIISAYVFYRLCYEEFIINGCDFKNIFNSVKISGVIILLNIFLAVFGFGYRTYEGSTDRMSGFIGYMSGNCVTANSLIIALTINVILYFNNKNWKTAGMCLLNLLGLVMLATKFSVFGSLIMVVAVYFYYIYFSSRRKRNTLVVRGLFLGVLSLLFVIPFLNSYIDKIMIQANKYNYDFITMLTSNRGLQLLIVNDYYINQISTSKTMISLFGASYSHTNIVLNTINSGFVNIELDYHGIYYYLGALALIVILLFYFNILRKGLFLTRRKDVNSGLAFIGIIVILLSALLGGHVLYESTTLVYLMIPASFISAKFYLRRKKA